MMPSPPRKRRRREGSPVPGSSDKNAKNAIDLQTIYHHSNSRGWKQWKKKIGLEYNSHKFLDASATAHAGLFGSRRLPEIKSLWRLMIQGELSSLNEKNGRSHAADSRCGESGGGKISSRHLRRRTSSFIRRRRHRFPLFQKKIDEFGESGKYEQHQQGAPATLCRRAKRKPALMKKNHSSWWQRETDSQILPHELKSCHNWIPTHLWHSKRFHVSPPLFSWSVPLLHSNRGPHASLRLCRQIVKNSPKCTIQDATWEINGCAIKLEVKTIDSSSLSTQEPVQNVSSILRRLFGPEASFLNEQNILMGLQAGVGLIHDIDAFPLKPIGPATFIFGPPCSCNGSGSAEVSILVHPAIHNRTLSLLNTILENSPDASFKATLLLVPVALLRIRGRASSSTVEKVLFGDDYKTESLCRGVNNGTLIEVGPGSPMKVSKDSNKSPIFLKSHQPNQSFQHLPHNLASSGWDIFCHPSIGLSLFQQLVNKGGACPIGLVEDSWAHLEAYPPLPLFPRDYPDTEEGKSYWECSDAQTQGATKEIVYDKGSMTAWKDWAIIRAFVEGSWGRLNTSLKRTIRQGQQMQDAGKEKKPFSECISSTPTFIIKTQSFGENKVVNWKSIVSPEAENTVVVRGIFGMPFRQLLDGCGKLCHKTPCADSTTTLRCRRPRRQVKCPDSAVRASPLSNRELEVHSNLCHQLRTSLSLPAILRCELHCDRKGKLNVGDLIFPLRCHSVGVGNSETDDEKMQALPFGAVVAGGFSPSRGKCHGVGFVGAARLIDDLDRTDCGMGMRVPESKGKKTIMLKVMIRGDSCGGCWTHALLSILL